MSRTPAKENVTSNGVDRSPLMLGRNFKTPDRGNSKLPDSRLSATPSRLPKFPTPGNVKASEQERVKVFVRVRPTSDGETGGAVQTADDGKALTIQRGKREDGTPIPEQSFDFDEVLSPSCSQQDVYKTAVQSIVDDTLNGYNGTVMAYGQTGAGKTYTLSSVKPDAIGMIPRAAADVFIKTKNDTTHDYVVFMSYIQIYMELIQDLLNPESDNLQLRENDGGVFVAGVKEIEVKSMEDCLRLLAVGDRNRTVAFTAMNAHSSRSHAIVMLTVIKRKRLPPEQKTEKQTVKVGKLFMVDLAGSERLKKSGSTGVRANEAKSINLSLTSLGMCINARADKTATHVPFRASKLTRLLQESLGGNAKTSLVVAVADAAEHAEETIQSLNFGSRAMCVKMQPVVNEHADYMVLTEELLAQLDTRDATQFAIDSAASNEQLENLEKMMKDEKDRSEAIMENLRGEREQAEQERNKLLEQVKALEEQQLHVAKKLNMTQDEKEQKLKLIQEQQRLLEVTRKQNERLASELNAAQEAQQKAAKELSEAKAVAEQHSTLYSASKAEAQENKDVMESLSRQLSQLKEELERKTRDLGSMRTSDDSARAQVTELQNKLKVEWEEKSTLVADLQKVKAQLAEKDAAMFDMDVNKSGLQKTVELLQLDLEKEKQELLAVQESSQEKSRTIEDLKHEKARQSSMLEEYNLTVEKQKETIKTLEAELQAAKVEAVDNGRAVEDLKHINARLEQGLDGLQEANIDYKQLVQQLEATIKTQQNSMEELHSKVSKLGELNNQKEGQLQGVGKELQEAKEALSSKLRFIEEMQYTDKRQKQHLNEQDQKMGELKASMLQLEKELTAAKADITAKVSRVQQLETNAGWMKSSMDDSEKKLETAKATVDSLQESQARLERTLEDRQSKIEQLVKDVNAAKLSADEALTEKSIIANENKKMRERIRELEGELSQVLLKAEREKAELQNSHLLEKERVQKQTIMDTDLLQHKHKLAAEELESKLQRSADELERHKRQAAEELEAQERKFSERIDAAKREVDRRDNAIAQLEDTIAQLQAQTQDLSAKLSDMTEKNQKLSVHANKLQSSVTELQQVKGQLEASLSNEQDTNNEISQQLNSVVKARREFSAVWLENRTRNGAARTIQRNYRDYRNNKIKRLQAQNLEALDLTKNQLGSLQLQYGALDKKLHTNLSWLGRMMVQNSMEMMAESAEGLLAMFILPQKERRTMSGVHQRLMSMKMNKKTRSQSWFTTVNLDLPVLVPDTTPPSGSVPTSPGSSPRASGDGPI